MTEQIRSVSSSEPRSTRRGGRWVADDGCWVGSAIGSADGISGEKPAIVCPHRTARTGLARNVRVRPRSCGPVPDNCGPASMPVDESDPAHRDRTILGGCEWLAPNQPRTEGVSALQDPGTGPQRRGLTRTLRARPRSWARGADSVAGYDGWMEASVNGARVTTISIAPIKGLAVRHVDAVEVGANGVAENRRLHFVDGDGRFVNGKTSMRLSLVGSRLDLAQNTLSLRDPRGRTSSPGALELGEPIETVFFGRPAQGRVVSGPWGAALSAWSGLDLRLVMSDEVGAASDRGPDAGVSIISEASVADLAHIGGVDALDSRRFRMLFEVDGVAPYAEDTLDRPRGADRRCRRVPARQRRPLRRHDVRSGHGRARLRHARRARRLPPRDRDHRAAAARRRGRRRSRRVACAWATPSPCSDGATGRPNRATLAP